MNVGASAPPGDRLRAAATTVLIGNWRSLHTLPAPGLYPHQWSWDSALIAMGLRHFSPRRAQEELESLFSAQWDDGRLPQIVFDPRRNDDYSPGAAFWRSEDIPGSPPTPTSGLIQPPVHAWAVLALHRADPTESRGRRFLQRAHPRLLAWHDYLRLRRDHAGGGPRQVHPWESGMDDSPAWDPTLQGVPSLIGDASAADLPRPDLLHVDPSGRPTSAEYGKYLYLAARCRDHACDDADPDYPFLAEDPAFNALWAVSELALAEIAAELGLPGAASHGERAAALVSALEALWAPDLGTFAARDVHNKTLARHTAVAGVIPLLVPGLPRAAELVEILRGSRFALGRVHLVPSYDLTESGFAAARYWRGPSWFNIAWLFVHVLRARSLTVDAQALADRACHLLAPTTFRSTLTRSPALRTDRGPSAGLRRSASTSRRAMAL